jgi:lipopolysaccharide transport system permease protein
MPNLHLVRELVRELWAYRELLQTLVIRELRVRYKNSALGFFWSLLNPLATVLVMTLVFKYVMGMRIANYSAYILAAYLPWTFFQFALLDSSQTILVYMQVIRKIYFPRVLLPLAAVLSNFIHFLLAMGVLFVYLYGYVGTPLQVGLLWLPVVMLSQLLWVIGLAAIIACWNVFYEDVKYLVSVGLQLLFFLTPVIYFSEQLRYTTLVPEAYREGLFWAYHVLNPMAALTMAYRKAILPPITIVQENAALGQAVQFPDMPLPVWLLGLNLLLGLGVALLGLSYFRKHEWEFVERP